MYVLQLCYACTGACMQMKSCQCFEFLPALLVDVLDIKAQWRSCQLSLFQRDSPTFFKGCPISGFLLLSLKLDPKKKLGYFYHFMGLVQQVGRTMLHVVVIFRCALAAFL